MTVMASELGYHEEYQSKKIFMPCYVHVDNRVNELSVCNADTWRNSFLLYQNLSSHIRGQAATFIDKKGHPVDFIPSFETRDTYFNRKKIIDVINNSENYYYLHGNLYDMVSFINDKCIEKSKIKERGR